MKRFFLCLFALIAAGYAAPARADICAAGGCGHWYSPGVDVLIQRNSLTWTDGVSDDCIVFAQDRYVTIAACSEYKTKAPQKAWDTYFFIQALGDDLHIRKSHTLPDCIARRSCWPRPGVDFLRLSGRERG